MHWARTNPRLLTTDRRPESMARVLIVDDDHLFNKMLATAIRQKGHESLQALTLADGLAACAANTIDVLFLDVRLPDGNGLSALTEFKAMPGEPEIIIVTGEGDPDGAELAINNGAWDYIEKPSSLDKITLPLLRALEYRRQKSSAPAQKLPHADIVGGSKALQLCLEQASQAAASDAAVLVYGETGSGKELVARAVHDASSRAKKPFVVVDCGALPESLLEAELFGHARGAFTGAHHARTGLVALADGGTLFLDEVGELPLSQQRAFLRVLQEKRFRPLGEKKEQSSDFRLLAATNKNLEALVEQGDFREDLFFRLRTMFITIPPLRERMEDIDLLAQYHMERLCAGYGIPGKHFAEDFLETLRAYDWPGNVRELFSVVERAVISGKHEPTLYATHLPTSLRVAKARGNISHNSAETHPLDTSRQEANIFATHDLLVDETGTPRPWKDVREQAQDDLERAYCKTLMAHSQGNVTAASRLSGLSRQRLHTLLRKHELTRQQSRDSGLATEASEDS